jgi:aryl-alcohol dehydrogenase-like predicted oxidoreductase
MFEMVDALQGVARDAGLTLTTLAVAWVLAHPAITAPIIGASRPDQLDDTIAAADVELDGDVKARLDELTTQYRMGDAAR